MHTLDEILQWSWIIINFTENKRKKKLNWRWSTLHAYTVRHVMRFTGRNLIDALIEMYFIVRSDIIVVAGGFQENCNKVSDCSRHRPSPLLSHSEFVSSVGSAFDKLYSIMLRQEHYRTWTDFVVVVRWRIIFFFTITWTDFRDASTCTHRLTFILCAVMRLHKHGLGVYRSLRTLENNGSYD